MFLPAILTNLTRIAAVNESLIVKGFSPLCVCAMRLDAHLVGNSGEDSSTVFNIATTSFSFPFCHSLITTFSHVF